MPFTVSHAVVALPFVRTPLVPGAIAVGAMTPDLPLFLPEVGIDYAATHDLRWLPVTAVLALGLLMIWRLLLRPVARALAPRWLAGRLPDTWEQSSRATLRETFPSALGLLWLAVALAIGVASHVLWDAFTHEGRAGSLLIPALAGQWGPLPGYRWMQYGSSLLGLVVLAVAATVWISHRRATPVLFPEPSAVRIVWWVSLPVILVAALAVGLAVWGPLDAEFTVRHLAYRVLPQACAFWGLLSLVLCAAILTRRIRVHRA